MHESAIANPPKMMPRAPGVVPSCAPRSRRRAFWGSRCLLVGPHGNEKSGGRGFPSSTGIVSTTLAIGSVKGASGKNTSSQTIVLEELDELLDELDELLDELDELE